jgi:hypothetical protein
MASGESYLMAAKDRTGTQPDNAGVGQPKDLYSTSDIRFVMVEIGKLTANVDHLIADIKSQGTKIDELRHQSSYIKGGIAVGTVLISAFIALAAFFLSSKWDALIAALKAVPSK